ncbi:MAG: efflux RND transporter periplasmic adaptor subunit [Acidobacteriota bacterium]
MKTKATLILVIAFVALASACNRKQEASGEKATSIANVKTERIVASALDSYYEATGTVRSAVSVALSSRVMGSVIALNAREGDRIRRGQTLIEIDSRDLAAQVQKAQAGLREAEQSLDEAERAISAARSAKAAAEANRELATATFNRYRTLLERRSVSPQEFDEVQTRLRVAEAEADRAEKMLQTLEAKKRQTLARIDQAKADISGAQVYASYAKIISPIDGIVTSRQTDLGQMAAPGAMLLTVEDVSRYRLEASVEESQIVIVKLNQEVTVLIDALGAVEIAGRVAEIVPAADPSSRSFTVKIDLPADHKSNLRSGLFGRARFQSGQKQGIAIPRQAIVERGQLTGVYVVDDAGIARLRFVKTGKSAGERVEILSGLGEGERIVIDGAHAITDGSRVNQV